MVKNRKLIQIMVNVKSQCFYEITSNLDHFNERSFIEVNALRWNFHAPNLLIHRKFQFAVNKVVCVYSNCAIMS